MVSRILQISRLPSCAAQRGVSVQIPDDHQYLEGIQLRVVPFLGNWENLIAISHEWGDPIGSIHGIEGTPEDYHPLISSAAKLQQITSTCLEGAECGILPLSRACPQDANSMHVVSIWMDNICIDQRDEAGKLREMQGMSNLYRQSAATVINLERQEGAGGGQELEELVDLLRRWQQEGSGSRTFAGRERVIALARQLGSSTWYSRLWSHQEAALAPKLFMSIYDRQRPLDVTILKEVKQIWLDIFRQVSNETPGQRLSLLRFLCRWICASSPSWMDAFLVTQWTDCSRDEDRVNALLGLMSIESPGFKTLEEGCNFAFDDCVNRTRSMDLLFARRSSLPPNWKLTLRNPIAATGRVQDEGRCQYRKQCKQLVITKAFFRYAKAVRPLSLQGDITDQILQFYRQTADSERLQVAAIQALASQLGWNASITWRLADYIREQCRAWHVEGKLQEMLLEGRMVQHVANELLDANKTHKKLIYAVLSKVALVEHETLYLLQIRTSAAAIRSGAHPPVAIIRHNSRIDGTEIVGDLKVIHFKGRVYKEEANGFQPLACPDPSTLQRNRVPLIVTSSDKTREFIFFGTLIADLWIIGSAEWVPLENVVIHSPH